MQLHRDNEVRSHIPSTQFSPLVRSCMLEENISKKLIQTDINKTSRAYSDLTSFTYTVCVCVSFMQYHLTCRYGRPQSRYRMTLSQGSLVLPFRASHLPPSPCSLDLHNHKYSCLLRISLFIS